MPELPDLTAYLEALEERLIGERLEAIHWHSPFVLRTVDPPASELVGRRIESFERLGKRLVFVFEGDRFVVLHLMIAGRLQWKAPGARPPGRIALATFDAPAGRLSLTEAGSKRRASIHLVRGREGLGAHDPGGIEPLTASPEEFRAALVRENRTLKRALTDPRLVSGIGNAYSDEILHRARLSPFARTGDLDDAGWSGLHRAVRETLAEWVARLRTERDGGFPSRVTAFRPEMAVHGRFGEPCPRCGEPVQRILYAENEANYCAGCQTGGKLLADRVLSKLLKGDWPKSLEELEERKAGNRAAFLAAALPALLLLGATGIATAQPGGSAPGGGVELTLPLPPRPADPSRLAAARSLLGDAATSGTIGPYTLLTDVDAPRLVERAAALARELEAAYPARYGLTPVGRPRESVVLFAREADYRAFQRREPLLAQLEGASGLAGFGLIATYRESRPDDEILATLAHEWVHLLNRRAIGPALPPWLEEGTADDLSSCVIGPAGELRPGTWSRILTPSAGGWRIDGGEAALRELVVALRRPDGGARAPLDLEATLKLDWLAFSGGEAAPLHYAAANAFLRWILADEELAGRLRRWFDAIATGEPVDLESLRAGLDRSWPEIQASLSAWLESEFAALPPLPQRSKSDS
ncbi:MAG: Fpg/Nei family DNA glycosylase [Thermoanaerobaculia bacterium]